MVERPGSSNSTTVQGFSGIADVNGFSMDSVMRPRAMQPARLQERIGSSGRETSSCGSSLPCIIPLGFALLYIYFMVRPIDEHRLVLSISIRDASCMLIHQRTTGGESHVDVLADMMGVDNG